MLDAAAAQRESLGLKDQLNDESVIKPRAKLVEPSFNGPKFSIIIFFFIEMFLRRTTYYAVI